jgi:hypothetical protein
MCKYLIGLLASMFIVFSCHADEAVHQHICSSAYDYTVQINRMYANNLTANEAYDYIIKNYVNKDHGALIEHLTLRAGRLVKLVYGNGGYSPVEVYERCLYRGEG